MNKTVAVGKPVAAATRRQNRCWLRRMMNPYFFIAMRDEPDAISLLERELAVLRRNRRMILADRDKSLILALVNQPGTLYETLRSLREREISYAMIAHSEGTMPGMSESLEIQRFEFDRKSNEEIIAGRDTAVPGVVRARIYRELRSLYPDFPPGDFDRLLRLLWLNNESYVRVSPPPGGSHRPCSYSIAAIRAEGCIWTWNRWKTAGSTGSCSPSATHPRKSFCSR